MNPNHRWDPCVYHRDRDAENFCAHYFANPDRIVLLIAGAGFDPRSARTASLIGAAAGKRVKGFFLREERSNPDAHLVNWADTNEANMRAAIPDNRVEYCQVFADDGAVIGGREAMRIMSTLSLSQYTDVVVDISAMSVGISFPILRYLLSAADSSVDSTNVHVLVHDHAETDGSIRSHPCVRPGPVHGFQGSLKTDATSTATKMWVPQLIKGKRVILEQIYRYVVPHDVCPVLPFPSADPRRCDALFEHYASELESTWEVDSRSILYADEGNPLDLYRTILRMDDERQRIFKEIGGSILVLSPLGNKAMALGCLMAAVVRDFPIVYVESIGYTVNSDGAEQMSVPLSELVHVWLAGDAYPRIE